MIWIAINGSSAFKTLCDAIKEADHSHLLNLCIMTNTSHEWKGTLWEENPHRIQWLKTISSSVLSKFIKTCYLISQKLLLQANAGNCFAWETIKMRDLPIPDLPPRIKECQIRGEGSQHQPKHDGKWKSVINKDIVFCPDILLTNTGGRVLYIGSNRRGWARIRAVNLGRTKLHPKHIEVSLLNTKGDLAVWR